MVLMEFLPEPARGLMTSPLGLQLAKLADLPDDVLNEATRVTGLLEEKHSAEKASSEVERIAQRRKIFLRVMIISPSPAVSDISPRSLTLILLPLPSQAAPDTTHSGG